MKKIGLFVLLIVVFVGMKMGYAYAFDQTCVNTNCVTPVKQSYQDMQQQVEKTQVTDIQTSYDKNNDGICDNSQDQGRQNQCDYVDDNNDGVCDNYQDQGRHNQCDYVDENNDGICDHYQNKDQCLNNTDCQTQRQQTRHHGGNHH